MTGIDVPIRSDGHILTARPAAPQPLDDTGPLSQIHIEVEEVHVLPPLQLPGQLLVFRLHCGQVSLLDGEGVVQRSAGRFHRNMAEAQGSQVLHVVGKVQVLPGEGAPHIVVLGPPLRDQLLELGDDHVIAPLPVDSGAHVVVDLPPAVQGEHHVRHLPVDVVDGVLVQQDTVGCDRKAETLVVLFLQGAGVLYRPLDGVQRHQRFPAEKVHLNVPPLARLLHHPVDGPLGGIKVHGHAVSGTEVASRGKAVAATQVAVVGDMQTQCLHHRRLGQGHGGSRVDVVVI